jgi:hypothetical protein
MDSLLQNGFINYYYAQFGVSIGETLEYVRKNADVELQNTNKVYFEISDVNGRLIIYPTTNNGTARFQNPHGYCIAVVNYDNFLTNLPEPIKKHKKCCDAILYALENKTYFLLCEFKKIKNYSTKTSASRQLSQSLEMLVSVPEIREFVDNFRVRRCCCFIKKALDPDIEHVNAPSAFNRLNKLLPETRKLNHKLIEHLGFELYRYPDVQCFKFE